MFAPAWERRAFVRLPRMDRPSIAARAAASRHRVGARGARRRRGLRRVAVVEQMVASMLVPLGYSGRVDE